MSDDPFPASGPGAGPPALAPGKHRGPRFSWNTAIETTFFNSLCESVNLGLREGNTFKPEAWDRALQAIITHHGALANKGHLINKSDNARKKFRLWRGLREDPEFHYDVMTRTVNASEEAWARHLQVRLCYVGLCHVMSCQVLSCPVMSCHAGIPLPHPIFLTLILSPLLIRWNHSLAPFVADPLNMKPYTRSCFPMSSAPAVPPND